MGNSPSTPITLSSIVASFDEIKSTSGWCRGEEQRRSWLDSALLGQELILSLDHRRRAIETSEREPAHSHSSPSHTSLVNPTRTTRHHVTINLLHHFPPSSSRRTSLSLSLLSPVACPNSSHLPPLQLLPTAFQALQHLHLAATSSPRSTPKIIPLAMATLCVAEIGLVGAGAFPSLISPSSEADLARNSFVLH